MSHDSPYGKILLSLSGPYRSPFPATEARGQNQLASGAVAYLPLPYSYLPVLLTPTSDISVDIEPVHAARGKTNKAKLRPITKDQIPGQSEYIPLVLAQAHGWES